MESKYKVGDRVKIVDRPVKCKFDWVPDMDDCCGKEATITDVGWSDRHRAFCYRIDICGYGWCENCFVDQVPCPVIDIDEISKLLFDGL